MGQNTLMIGVALALVVLGVILLFIIPWVGIAAGIAGLILLVLYAAGVGFAFVSPWISYGIYVAVALIWFVPDRRFTRS